jgi:hypothetical protein
MNSPRGVNPIFYDSIHKTPGRRVERIFADPREWSNPRHPWSKSRIWKPDELFNELSNLRTEVRRQSKPMAMLDVERWRRRPRERIEESDRVCLPMRGRCR